MKLPLKKISVYSLLIFLMICATGNVIVQVFSIVFFGTIMLFVKGINNNVYFITFYISLLFLSLIQLLFFWRDDYSNPYIINTLLISAMWVFAFLAHNFIVNSVKICSLHSLQKVINYFFALNIVLLIVQYFGVCLDAKSFFPFSVAQYGMSTGDYLKGFFSNSSVNMVVMAFFSIYYFTLNKKFKTIISILVTLLTTYMSGILIGLGIISTYAFFKFKLANKAKIIVMIVAGFYLFSIVSPENIKYVKHIFTEKINSKTDPVRKLVSFEETASNFVSSPQSFLFGEGGGKFSSRTAYLTGGEYVKWYPETLIYRSEKFEKNHFKLWNNEALKIPFRDGTANQPFSFYNKIIGEYGFLGIFLFTIYLYYFFKHFRFLTYGKLIILLMLGFFLLDYWFEYFTVILFFELFMLIDIKRHKELVNNEAQ